MLLHFNLLNFHHRKNWNGTGSSYLWVWDPPLYMCIIEFVHSTREGPPIHFKDRTPSTPPLGNLLWQVHKHTRTSTDARMHGLTLSSLWAD